MEWDAGVVRCLQETYWTLPKAFGNCRFQRRTGGLQDIEGRNSVPAGKRHPRKPGQEDSQVQAKRKREGTEGPRLRDSHSGNHHRRYLTEVSSPGQGIAAGGMPGRKRPLLQSIKKHSSLERWLKQSGKWPMKIGMGHRLSRTCYTGPGRVTHVPTDFDRKGCGQLPVAILHLCHLNDGRVVET